MSTTQLRVRPDNETLVYIRLLLINQIIWASLKAFFMEHHFLYCYGKVNVLVTNLDRFSGP